jgi:hypothetical protein
MIIECPTCGFTGRVPNYVAAAPYHARCPKCQDRFALGEAAEQSPVANEDRARRELRHDLTRPPLDPSSSSYEIEALTDDFDSDEDEDHSSHSHDWDDDWDGEIEADDASDPAVETGRLPRFLLNRTGSTREPATGRDRPTATVATPWRIRLFEAWAILFIIWAALIGSRAILATISRDQDSLFSTATIWPVASVVLLVSASAGLFLLIDLSRRFAAPPPGAISVPPLPSGAPAHRNGSIEPAVIKSGNLTTG